MKATLLTGLVLATSVIAQASDPEPATAGGLEWLKKVQPETGHVMIEVSDRYKNLYFAAKQGNWGFAAYQTEEIEEAMERLALLKPELKERLEDFVETGLEPVEEAVETKDWARFADAFEHMRGRCVACHVDNGQPYIQVKRPIQATSPVLVGD
jgi:hypothetical protein